LDRQIELLDGVIIDMEPVSPWHANIGDILSRRIDLRELFA
jgi:Uma2 family endonuclease